MLPNFIIIGSQKAGTSSIYNVARSHPDIYMPQIKEIRFFANDNKFLRGIKYYEEYFKHAPPHKIAYGEATPGYICYPNVPARISFCLPKVKLILTVRNPVDRAYSQYWHNRRNLSEPLSFNKVIAAGLSDTYIPGKIGYFSRGTYIRYIKSYLKYFDTKQLLVLVFDDLLDNPIDFYKKIFSFLNVDSSFTSLEIKKVFNSPWIWDNYLYKFLFYKPSYQVYLSYFPKSIKKFLFWGKKIKISYPPLDHGCRKTIDKFFAPWNKELSYFLGRDLTKWGSGG